MKINVRKIEEWGWIALVFFFKIFFNCLKQNNDNQRLIEVRETI